MLLSELSKTISFGEPRPPETLGGDITRACIGLLDGRDRRFAKVLSDERIFENVSAALTAYLEKIEAAHPDEVIRTVVVRIHDYLEQLGIGLMSCRVELLSHERGGVLRLSDEEKSPIVGVIPEVSKHDAQPAVAFSPVENGGEELTALTDDLCLRGYLPGERPPPFEVMLLPVQQGNRVLVPQKAAIGVRLSLINKARLPALNFRRNVVPLICDDLRIKSNIHPGQVYFCRYLTKKAVREALGL